MVLACLCLSPCQQYYTNYMFLNVYLYPHSPYPVICNVFLSQVKSVGLYKSDNSSDVSLFFNSPHLYLRSHSEKRVKAMCCELRILAVAVLAMVIMPGLLAARYRYYQQRNAICYLPQKPGPNEGSCYAYFPRYFYNSRTGRCQFFVYGGCNGNANNFE